ncbi:MAG: tetratricopeptide repeat protein, partial [Myxococcota bacterium]
ERMGEFERSLDMTRRARTLFAQLGAFAEETNAMIGIGRTYVVQCRYRDASVEYDAIIERVQASGDLWLERVARNHIAVIRLCLGEFEPAMASIQRALTICRRYGDHAREGDCLSVGGTILLEVGRNGEASEYFQRALAILERTESRWSRADCLVYAGLNQARLGHFDRALEMIDESLRLAGEIGAPYIHANALLARSGALLERDDASLVSRAREATHQAVAIAREAELVGSEIQGLSRLALATWRGGDLEQAIPLSVRALELLDAQGTIEGAEEEVFYIHYQLLRAAADDGAGAVLARARTELDRKMAAMNDPAWLEAYRAVPLIAAVLAASAAAA